MSKLRRALAFFLVVLVCWFVAASSSRLADARPGGGQNYRAPSRSSSSYSGSRSSGSSSRSSGSGSWGGSSSRSSGSSSYGGSGSYGGSSSYGSRSSSSGSYGGTATGVYVGSGGGISAGTVIFIFVVVIFIVVFVSMRNKKQQAGRARIEVDADVQGEGLAALRKQDPAFSPEAFVQRARTVVTKVNEAWCGGAMGPARRLISDGVYVRFQTQLALLKADGLRNAMADWRVVSADILAAESDDNWDTVHVKIVGAARDLDLPLSLSAAEAQKRLRGAELGEYHEVWSFVRRRGKKSKSGVPALEGRCPSCGADMPLSEIVKCEYCQALVNSGEHDWVLAEITQPEEWRPGAALDHVDGLDTLRARDATVSRQELEDRASVVFWKWVEARSTGKPDKLARFCIHPPKDAAAAAELGLGVAKLRQVAVGSAELVRVAQSGEQDLAVVEIRWSAGVDGREPDTLLHRFVLARASTATSKRGLSSLDCPVCGGQLADSDAVTCQYCGATLSGGKHEWALRAVEQGEVPPGDYGGGDDGEHDDDVDLRTPGQKAFDAASTGLAVGLAVASVLGAASDDDD